LIESEEEIVELRRIREKLINITVELEEYLKQKIEFVLKEYENKLAKV
jgi:hypothetical protein